MKRDIEGEGLAHTPPHLLRVVHRLNLQRAEDIQGLAIAVESLINLLIWKRHHHEENPIRKWISLESENIN